MRKRKQSEVVAHLARCYANPFYKRTSPSETDPEVRFAGRHATYMMKQKAGTSKETTGETREDLDHNPYVFIVGCARFGTTLLQRLVDAHPLIAITSQTNWVTRYFEIRTGVTPEGLVTSEMIPRLIEHHNSPPWGSTGRTLKG
jgi:hypothetical protein